MSMMPTCREVARSIASDELATDSPLRRLLIQWHLFRCGDCREYQEQIRGLGRAVRATYGGSEGQPSDIDRLAARILAEPPGKGEAASPADPTDFPNADRS